MLKPRRQKETSGVEQFAKADLLVIMLFAQERRMIMQKGLLTGAGSLVPPLVCN